MQMLYQLSYSSKVNPPDPEFKKNLKFGTKKHNDD